MPLLKTDPEMCVYPLWPLVYFLFAFCFSKLKKKMVSASYSSSLELCFLASILDPLVSLIHTRIAKYLLFKVRVRQTFRINACETTSCLAKGSFA